MVRVGLNGVMEGFGWVFGSRFYGKFRAVVWKLLDEFLFMKTLEEDIIHIMMQRG